MVMLAGSTLYGQKAPRHNDRDWHNRDHNYAPILYTWSAVKSGNYQTAVGQLCRWRRGFDGSGYFYADQIAGVLPSSFSNLKMKNRGFPSWH